MSKEVTKYEGKKFGVRSTMIIDCPFFMNGSLV